MIFIYYTGFGTDVSIYYTQFSRNNLLSLHRLMKFSFSVFYTSCEAPEKSGIIQNWTFRTPENEFGVHDEPQWTPLGFIMNPKIWDIRDSKEFIIADFPERKLTVSRRIQKRWHDRIGTRAWRKSWDLDSFWAHFLIETKQVLICIRMWTFGAEILESSKTDLLDPQKMTLGFIMNLIGVHHEPQSLPHPWFQDIHYSYFFRLEMYSFSQDPKSLTWPHRNSHMTQISRFG